MVYLTMFLLKQGCISFLNFLVLASRTIHWIDGWKDAWKDDRRMHGRMHQRMHGRIHGRMCGSVDLWVEERKDGCLQKQHEERNGWRDFVYGVL